MVKRVAVLPGLLVPALLLGGCADHDGQPAAYADHCRATLGRLVEPTDRVLLLESRSSVEREEGAERVHVDLDFELNEVPRRMRCTYPRRAGGMEPVAANRIAVDGEPISEADVRALNEVVGRTDRPMERIRRRIPNPNLFPRDR